MNKPDLIPPTVPAAPSPERRAYNPPRITDLGGVRELTRGASAGGIDGKGSPGHG